jgi:hypothetical protein
LKDTLPCRRADLLDLGFGSFERKMPHIPTPDMDIEHDSGRFGWRLAENTLQHLDHELHGGVVVIKHQHFEVRDLRSARAFSATRTSPDGLLTSCCSIRKFLALILSFNQPGRGPLQRSLPPADMLRFSRRAILPPIPLTRPTAICNLQKGRTAPV